MAAWAIWAASVLYVVTSADFARRGLWLDAAAWAAYAAANVAFGLKALR